MNLPTDEWLCKKLDKLNLALVKGYPSRISEAGGLLRDRFGKTARSQSKWYSLHSERTRMPVLCLSGTMARQWNTCQTMILYPWLMSHLPEETP